MITAKIFNIENRTVEIYACTERNKPVIYFNNYDKSGSSVYRILKEITDKDFSLVVIGNLNWDGDMTPYAIPPIFPNDTPCSGEADEYLRILTEKIIPASEEHIRGKPEWRAITGYSLAGLFAIYSLYKTDIFSRAASMSGSLLYPDFKEYIFNHELKRMPDYIYFSLGNKESKTRNPYLKTVQENTEQIECYYAQKNIPTVFELNEGNHFKDCALRSAKGIKWILEN